MIVLMGVGACLAVLACIACWVLGYAEGVRDGRSDRTQEEMERKRHV